MNIQMPWRSAFGEFFLHVLCACGLLRGSHGGTVLVNHSGHFPLTLTHLMLENHVDIPWNSVLWRRFCDMRREREKWERCSSAHHLASAMRLGSNADGRHNIGVVKLAGMDGEGERSIFMSHESGHRCSRQWGGRCFCYLRLISLVVDVRQRYWWQRCAWTVAARQHTCARTIEGGRWQGQGGNRQEDFNTNYYQRSSIFAHIRMTLKRPVQWKRWPSGPDAHKTRPHLGLFLHTKP